MSRVSRVLFLDFDGVLHPGPASAGDATGSAPVSSASVVLTPHFGWAPLLARLLTPHPDVALVISSTWRYTHNFEELADLLGPLGPRVVGATPRGPRYEAILWWLHLNPTFSSYRILDDAPREFPVPPPAELVVCNPSAGVSALDVQALLKSWLNEGWPLAGK